MKDNKLKLNPGKMEVLIGGRGGGCHSSKKLVDLPVLNEVMLSQIEKIKSFSVCVYPNLSLEEAMARSALITM